MAAIHTLLPQGQALTLLTYGLAAVGSLFLLSRTFSFLRVLLDTLVIPGQSLSKYGATKGAWSVVTGATQGIGLSFAKQLAKAGFNVVLVSRSQSKLDEVAAEISTKYSVQTKVISVDFAAATEQDYSNLKASLESLDVGVLVNNVGISYDYPRYFYELSEAEIDAFVHINIQAQLRVTRYVLPGMVQRKRGLILNMGSFAAFIPAALLAVYAGSKGFLKIWSQALGEELKGTGVTVQLVNGGFITSALSKIRKPKWDVPTPDVYVNSVLRSIGQTGGAPGQPYMSNPFWAHALMQWVPDHIGTESFWMWWNKSLQLSIRKRALKKRQREADKKTQ
ncbi:NAD(P)-binding protein [Atractiella rhizophila]|nr:NAD(P)-binding protein [Atractiella rhizophila]